MHRQFDLQRNRILADISSEAQLEDFPHRFFINGVVSINIQLADWTTIPRASQLGQSRNRIAT